MLGVHPDRHHNREIDRDASVFSRFTLTSDTRSIDSSSVSTQPKRKLPIVLFFFFALRTAAISRNLARVTFISPKSDLGISSKTGLGISPIYIYGSTIFVRFPRHGLFVCTIVYILKKFIF